MSAIKKQLDILDPILDASPDDRGLLEYLLKDNDDEDYKSNPFVRLLGELAFYDRVNHVMRTPGGFGAVSALFMIRDKGLYKFFLRKVINLIQNDDPDKACSVKENKKDETILTIGDSKYNLGKFKIPFQPKEHELQILSPFFKLLGNALEEHLTSGVLYIGYPKNSTHRTFAKYQYIVLYVQHEREEVIKKIPQLEWQPLFFKKKDGLVKQGEFNGIRFTESENALDIQWTFFSPFYLLANLFVLAILAFNIYHKFLSESAEAIVSNFTLLALIGLALLSVLLLIIGLANRKKLLYVNEHELGFDGGRIPFFWGYKRIRIPRKDVLKVFLGTGKGDFYKLHVTKYPGENVRLTGDMGNVDIHMIKDLIEDFLKRK